MAKKKAAPPPFADGQRIVEAAKENWCREIQDDLAAHATAEGHLDELHEFDKRSDEVFQDKYGGFADASRLLEYRKDEANHKAERAKLCERLGVTIESPGGGEAADPPPLSDAAAAVYEFLLALPDHRAKTGPKIVDELNRRDPTLLLDEGSFRSRIVAELQPYGIENVRRIGYRIKPSRRPPS